MAGYAQASSLPLPTDAGAFDQAKSDKLIG